MEKNTKRLTETLIRGRDSAKMLQSLLRRKENGGGSDSAYGPLVIEILGSLTVGLSILNSCDSDEFSGVPASPCSVDQKPEVNTGKKPAPEVKERRGCYKRRKTIDSRVNISHTTEDGYAWRKYGQKEILNSKFPRCYFRCTHKPVHGCKAQKQVQKLEDESNMFHITYFGHHTCPCPTTNAFSHSGVVLDFNDSKNHRYFPNSPSSLTNIHIDPSIKLEAESKAQSTDVSDNVSSANDDHSPPTLGWMDVLIDDLDHGHGHGHHHDHGPTSFKGFEYEDSSASTSSYGYLFDVDFLNEDGLLNEFL
nr:WRKY4002 [Atractylodes chinensis]